MSQERCGYRMKTQPSGFTWECVRQEGHPTGKVIEEIDLYGRPAKVRRSEGHWFRKVEEVPDAEEGDVAGRAE